VFSPLSWLWTAVLVQGTIKSLFPLSETWCGKISVLLLHLK
jgi:hypothetical protein